ncbi:PilZ domain-containing protein [Marinagarivorans algicola]|uniref:PilZ domain-containing protein n=1 Tax=Marinagarivorans algicola TaxID=1513270 RepID=UPI0006B4E257|nr:PilZ domain-containing protein [Marinagarivorans algicola]
MSSQQEERRQYSRVTFEAQAIISQGNKSFITELIDISLNGLLAKTPEHYHLRSDMPCSVKIILSPELAISMQAALVHSSHRALGLHCTSIDMDSITHLRKLIESNIEDPHASERVLSELVLRADMP